MPDITTRDLLINALATGQNPQLIKASQVSKGAGTWHSFWKAVGYPANAASPPLFSAGAGYVPTQATVGAIPFTNATVGNTLRLLFASLNSSVPGTLILADRLWACSGLGTVVTTAQTVVTPGTVTRDANGAALGAGCEPWLEFYTAPGATAATWTVDGTDAGGTAGRTWVYGHAASAEVAGQMSPLFPAGATPGQLHMRSPNSLTCSLSSGTAGDVGITIIRRLAQMPLAVANMATVLDAIALAMPKIQDNSCLMLMVQCSSTTTGLVLGNINLGQA
jgi:hypothetical protein